MFVGTLIASVFCVIVTESVAAELTDRRFGNDTKEIVHYLTRGNGRSLAYQWLRTLVDQFGHRMTGSVSLEKAIDDVVKRLKENNFDNVHTEDVPNLPNWIRGNDIVELIEPRPLRLNALAIGGTEPSDVKAEAVVIRDFDDIQHVNVTGKIVVTAQSWRGYPSTVKYRHSAKKFASLGAVGLLVKSITPFSINSPHVGKGSNGGRIPVLAITLEDAEMLNRMYRDGQKITIKIHTESHTNSTITSRNIIFEIAGNELASEVVLLSAHMDSWDVGQGALDDGGGCAAVWSAMFALKQLQKTNPKFAPRRTIRAVFWTAEEQDYLGAKYYYETHRNETFYFVSETDQGAFRPKQWNSFLTFAGTPQQAKNLLFLACRMSRMDEIVRLLNHEGIPLGVLQNPNQGDVTFWSRNGVPATNYISDRAIDYYFYFHHSAGDSLTIFTEDDLDYTAAIFAVLAHTIANMDGWTRTFLE